VAFAADDYRSQTLILGWIDSSVSSLSFSLCLWRHNHKN